jgi:sialidase-1
MHPFRSDWQTGGFDDGFSRWATFIAPMKFAIGMGLMVAASAGAADSFEDYPAGKFDELATPAGVWTVGSGQAEIHRGHAKSGNQSLRWTGGAEQVLDLKLGEPLRKAGRVRFWSERWTARNPFKFRIEAAGVSGDFKEVWTGDRVVRVGGFLTRVEARLPLGTARLRFRGEAPANTGAMIDDFEVAEEKPMKLLAVDVEQPVVPVLRNKTINPVVGLRIATEGALKPLELEAVEVEMAGTSRPVDVAEVVLLSGSAGPDGEFGDPFGKPASAPTAVFVDDVSLEAGDNWFWVSVQLRPDADIDGLIDARVTRVKISGQVIEVVAGSPPGAQRIGVALRQRGDDGSKAYRIPGMVRTNRGTLIAVYDIRHRGGGDLPGDIDVGMSRSTDGGQTWEPMRTIMDMGDEARWNHDGVGDPSVLVDRVTGRIWVAALWSHGNRAWHGSGPGLEPEETGQLVLVSSDDDGRSWSEPVNITAQVKDPAWRLLLDGPGAGITMKDGTLVFPAQFRAADGVPWSTLIWSRDRGQSWHIGTGVKSNTTEAQLVELEEGVIMINCRDNRGGSRTVATSRDLGRTWQAHPTDRSALPESVCMASLLKWDVPGAGEHLFFSNPATTRGRHTMTVKVSRDHGLTWPEGLHTLYDRRAGAGYSCLAPADDEHLGILYEGQLEIYFLRIPVKELLDGTPAGALVPRAKKFHGARVPLNPFRRRPEHRFSRPSGLHAEAHREISLTAPDGDRMPTVGFSQSGWNPGLSPIPRATTGWNWNDSFLLRSGQSGVDS